jgi:hypothetical protein
LLWEAEKGKSLVIVARIDALRGIHFSPDPSFSDRWFKLVGPGPLGLFSGPRVRLIIMGRVYFVQSSNFRRRLSRWDSRTKIRP